MNRREFETFNKFKLERAKLFNGMLKILGTDRRVYHWLDTENPNLGSVRPIELIVLDKEEKLIRFIEGALSESEL